MTKTHKTDLKFFTNLPGETLLDRFVKTIEHAKFFDVLVGYFRISGFNKLASSLGKTEQIRILVGLNTDRRSYELIQFSKGQQSLQLESVKKSRDIFAEALAKEIESDENESEVEKAANTFIELIKSGKLHFRVHPDKNIHAKIYITRFDEDFIDFGRVITGSSNFSESGFEAQREFNVELKDRVDVEYALERFEELWEQGIDISEEFIDTIKNKTWLKDNITPYEIYLKLLYEYFKEDINVDEEIDITTPDDFMKLEYQKQAVLSANKILDIYDGVFLSDVVGLGKTFITAMFLQQLPKGRKLVICPPVLADYWKETLNQFYVSGFEIESLGKLDKILERGTDKYTYIIIDEAHRFRNEMTKSYDNLLRICEGKKVVLISATPYNNRLEDIKAQIKLFQPIKNSKIPGIPNLDNFFKNLQKELDNFEKGTPEYLDAVKRTSEKVRDKVLKHIMVRRTRSEIKKYFSDDLVKQGLRFPDVHEPQRIIYEFDSKTEKVFNDINLHRSNILINYDLPWNPTRVLQRVGRVNRVGSEHDKVFVFNIFPTSQSDEHLGLEGNIKSKIQAFHNILGEDAKYLFKDGVTTYKLPDGYHKFDKHEKPLLPPPNIQLAVSRLVALGCFVDTGAFPGDRSYWVKATPIAEALIEACEIKR